MWKPKSAGGRKEKNGLKAIAILTGPDADEQPSLKAAVPLCEGPIASRLGRAPRKGLL